MKITALDGGSASRGWSPVKHHPSEFLIVVAVAEDMQAADYMLFGSELFKQSSTTALAAVEGNESL